MSKAVLISIRPEWGEKIINGQKTIEVRKTRQKMNPPFLWEFTGLRETKFGEEPGQSPDRRRAGGMWRKNYGKTD